MAFFDYVKKGWEVARLKTDTVQDLATDQKALGPALGILAIGGVCAAIGSLSLLGIIYIPIIRLIGAFVFVWIMHFAATAFLGGKGDFRSVFVPLSCATVVSWIGIIPVIGTALAVLAGLWLLVVAVIIAQKIYGFDLGKAIIAVAVPVGVAIVLSVIFGAILALSGLSLWALMGR